MTAVSPARGGGSVRSLVLQTLLWGSLFLAGGAALAAFLSFRLFTIPAGSMAPEVPAGKWVIASRASYGFNRFSFDLLELPIAGRWLAFRLPDRGDVAVFRQPRDRKTYYIKRIVGVPGDRIQMIGGALHINGAPVRRERVADIVQDTQCGPNQAVHVYRETLPNGRTYLTQKLLETCSLLRFGALDDTQVFAVPADSYFMLGDNRDNSADSRSPENMNGIGFVPFELILGPVFASFSPTWDLSGGKV